MPLFKYHPMYQEIANENPKAAFQLISDYGYKVPRDITVDELADLLKQLVKRHGKPALAKVAKLHPDRDLLEGNYEHFDGGDCDCKDCRTETHHNASGGGCGCGGGKETYLGADGANNASDQPKANNTLSPNQALFALAMINIAAMCFITVIALKK